MHRVSLRFAPVLIALLMAFSVVQIASAAVHPAPLPDSTVRMQGHGDDEEAADEEGGHGAAPATSAPRDQSIASVVLWSLAALGGLGIILTALYMLKRRVGAFPENPDWVAPIEVLYSKNNPDEGYFGDSDTAHAHGSHH